MTKCCIVYGSETGSTEIASYSTYLELYKNGIPVEIHLSDLVDLDLLLLYDYVIFFLPTCAFGEFPHNFETLLADFIGYQNKNKTIPSFKYTIFGLGDSRYPLYNFAARRLQSLLISLEAKMFFPLALGDDQHPLGFDGELIPWRNDLLANLKEHMAEHISNYRFEDIVYPYRIESLDKLDSTEPVNKLFFEDLCDQKLSPTSYKRGFVTGNKVITSESHFSSVRSIQIETKNCCYKTGDVLCLFPKDSDVDSLLKNIGVNPKERICIRRNWNGNFQTVLSVHNEYNSYPLELLKRKLERSGVKILQAQIDCFKQALKILTGSMILSSRTLPIGVNMTVSKLFKKYLCLNNICTPFQMYVMSFYTNDNLHKEKLLEMSSDTLDGCLEYYRYCKRERRSFYEVLYDFNSVKLPLDVLINICSPYYSRLYSIASSELDFVDKHSYSLMRYPLSINYPRFKAFLDYQYKRTNRIELIVGNVNYKMEGKRSVDGIASNYLNSLKLVDEVEFLIYKPNFKSLILNIRVPVLFIATGTGITVPKPYIEQRSFKFKEVWKDHKLFPNTKDMAFMGFRRPSQDHLYFDYRLYEHWCKFVFVYSRAGETKFYVQDSIKLHTKEVYAYLRKGLIVIGGKSHPMPSHVLESLVFVLETEAGFGKESAQQFIDNSLKQYKILIDTWG